MGRCESLFGTQSVLFLKVHEEGGISSAGLISVFNNSDKKLLGE